MMFRKVLSLVLMACVICFPSYAQVSTSISLSENPFELKAVLEKDGTTSLLINHKGNRLNAKSHLAISTPNDKELLYDKIQDGNHKVSNLQYGQNYIYVINFSLELIDEEYETYTGEFVIYEGLDDASTAPHLKHKSTNISGYSDDYSMQAIVYEQEPNNTFGASNVINNNDDVYGRISSSNDIDYFRIIFPSHGHATFFLTNIPAGRDYDLHIYDQYTNLIASSTNASNNTELISDLAVVANQIYYIRVTGWNGSFDSNNFYWLKAYASYSGATPDQYEPNNTFATATVIDKYANISANIHTTNDIDYYRFHLQESKYANNNLNVRLTNIPFGTDYELKIYNNLQQLIGQSTRSGNSDEEVTLSITPGIYYIQVYSYSGSSPNNYNLSVKAGFSALKWDYFTSTSSTTVTSPYGNRVLGGVQEFHKGIDIGGNQHSLYNVQSGIVIGKGFNSCMGNFVAVKTNDKEKNTGFPLVTRTIHMHSIASTVPAVNGSISKGAYLGLSGGTGTCTTGPHIHFDVNFANANGTFDGPQINESNSINPAQFWPDLFPNYQFYQGAGGSTQSTPHDLDSHVDPHDEYHQLMHKYDRAEYNHDWRLIEYVGVDNFFEWLNNGPLEETTTTNFKIHFNINKELEVNILSGNFNK